MAEKHKLKPVILKNTKVVFSRLDEPKAYMDKGDPRYSVSLLLEKGDDNYKKFIKAVKELGEDYKLSESRLNEMLAKKLKKVPESSQQYIDDLSEDSRMLNASCNDKNKPEIYNTKKEIINDKVFSGDIVTIKLVLAYYKTNGDTLAVWPNKVVLIEKSKRKDVDWDDVFSDEDADDDVFTNDSKNKADEKTTTEDFDAIDF